LFLLYNLSATQDVVTLILGIIAIISFLAGGLKWIILPIRKVVKIAEASKELTDAQLKENGGGSLTDRTRTMYEAMFPDQGNSIFDTVYEIRDHQTKSMVLQDERHKSNTDKLGQLEEKQGEMTRRLDAIELRQSYGGRILELVFAEMPQELKVVIDGILENNPPPKELNDAG